MGKKIRHPYECVHAHFRDPDLDRGAVHKKSFFRKFGRESHPIHWLCYFIVCTWYDLFGSAVSFRPFVVHPPGAARGYEGTHYRNRQTLKKNMGGRASCFKPGNNCRKQCSIKPRGNSCLCPICTCMRMTSGVGHALTLHLRCAVWGVHK